VATKQKAKNAEMTVEGVHNRWKTKFRKAAETVVHQMTGQVTEVSPQHFALYETALKAIYAHWFVGAHLNGRYGDMPGIMDYHQRIAGKNEIDLPYLSNAKCNSQEFCDQAARDYHFCAARLREANLYYALLD
jgi:hypothetical protein